MDLQGLRHAYECATQQVIVLEVYLHELTQRCERSLMDANADFDYLAFKLKIMAEVKKLYEQYRDMKHEEFQHQCASELTNILQHISDEQDLHDNSHHDNSYHDHDHYDYDSPVTSSPILNDIDIHSVPSLLTPIEEISLLPDISVQDVTHIDFESDFITEQFRNM